MIDILQQVLRKNSLSLTVPRKNVLLALAQNQPCTTAQLTRACPETDRVTVYRTVQLFEEIGITRRVWLGMKSVIELSELFMPHHHHLICELCGTTIEIHEEDIEANLKELASKYHFTLHQHSLELIGRCPECRVRHSG